MSLKPSHITKSSSDSFQPFKNVKSILRSWAIQPTVCWCPVLIRPSHNLQKDTRSLLCLNSALRIKQSLQCLGAARLSDLTLDLSVSPSPRPTHYTFFPRRSSSHFWAFAHVSPFMWNALSQVPSLPSLLPFVFGVSWAVLG